VECSFCGKDEHEVFRLLNGPGVCVCDECILLSQEIIIKQMRDIINSQEKEIAILRGEQVLFNGEVATFEKIEQEVFNTFWQGG